MQLVDREQRQLHQGRGIEEMQPKGKWDQEVRGLQGQTPVEVLGWLCTVAMWLSRHVIAKNSFLSGSRFRLATAEILKVWRKDGVKHGPLSRHKGDSHSVSITHQAMICLSPSFYHGAIHSVSQWLPKTEASTTKQ